MSVLHNFAVFIHRIVNLVITVVINRTIPLVPTLRYIIFVVMGSVPIEVLAH